jgi:hypothetical protein
MEDLKKESGPGGNGSPPSHLNSQSGWSGSSMSKMTDQNSMAVEQVFASSINYQNPAILLSPTLNHNQEASVTNCPPTSCLIQPNTNYNMIYDDMVEQNQNDIAVGNLLPVPDDRSDANVHHLLRDNLISSFNYIAVPEILLTNREVHIASLRINRRNSQISEMRANYG